jgi:uncharacterized membrane protein
MTRSASPTQFLSPDESAAVTGAVVEAERRTSAEIKVVTLRHCWNRIDAKAARIFRKLGLDKTRERNGVLILLVTTNREFIILGDQGIHEKVGQNFWDDVRDEMQAYFRADRFAEGLVAGIARIGEKLRAHFLRRADDRNEIPDEVTHED